MGSRGSVPVGKAVTMTASAADIANFIKQTLAKDRVVIFSKSYCPYCKMAKEAFLAENQQTKVVELDERTDGLSILSSLTEITGIKTVPQVFVDGKYVGGGSDVKALHESGELKTLLTSAESRQANL